MDLRNLIKVNFHSAVDVITNSSTTIFTYSEGSDTKAKELINEFLRVLGSDKKADDLFYMGIFCSTDRYYDYYDGNDDDVKLPKDVEEASYKDIGDKIEEYLIKVLKGEIERPDWMSMVDDSENYDGYPANTTLYIFPKEEKYKELGEKIVAFLYSTGHEASYD